MDASFTEHILERARERQKMLQNLNTPQQLTPLRETNYVLDRTQKIPSSSSHPSLSELKKTNRKEIVSESSISAKAGLFETPLKENVSEGIVQKIIHQNSSTKISSDIPGSLQPQLKTLNIQRDNINMEVKLISSDSVRVEVEIQESDSTDEEDGGNANVKNTHVDETPGLREVAKNKLKKLGRLYAGGEDADISSPIQRTEEKFLSDIFTPSSETTVKCVTKSVAKMSSRKGLSKLADLAQNISQWEDQTKNKFEEITKTSQAGSPRKSSKPHAPPPPTLQHSTNNNRMKPPAPRPPVTPTKSSSKEMTKDTPKQLKWDQAVLDTLESQGFTRSTSKARLIYKYNDSQEENRTHTDIKDKSQNKTNSETSVNVYNKMQIVDFSEEPEPEPEAKDVIMTKKFLPLNVQIEEQKVTPRSPSKGTRSAVIANRAALFESSPTKATKDPALLTLAERKALFEKNKGDALVPKAAFAMAVPSKEKAAPKPFGAKKPTANATSSDKIVTKPSNVTSATGVPKNTLASKIKPTANMCTNKQGSSNNHCDLLTKAAFSESGGIASKIAALIKNKNTISQQQIESSVKEQRQKEMEVLMNRFNRNKEVLTNMEEHIDESDSDDTTETTAMISEKPARIVTVAQTSTAIPPPPPPQSSGEKRRSGEKRSKKGDSPQVTAVLDDVKRIKITQAKDGRLYPCLSDIETATETEQDGESIRNQSPNSLEESFCSSEGGANTSFGREILKAVCKNQTPQKRPILDESTASDVSDILDDMDDYLDEAMAEEISDYSNGPTPPKLGKITSPMSRPQQSDSFHYKSFSPKVNPPNSPTKFKSPAKKITSPRKSTELPTHVVDGENILPLTHTVSFYRKQQTQVKTPLKQVNRQVILEETEEKLQAGESHDVTKKILELQDEVQKQQMIISQTSQALNLCNSTLEFVGSTEQVEAEKVLLLATHRRQACLHEIQRLKVEGTLRPQDRHAKNVPLEKGSLTINNITLPLKREYVRALAAAGGKGHHVVCLIKCGEQVTSTQLVSTVASSSKNPDQELNVPGTVRLENIFSDFTITFEVYCLQAQEEVLPHEVKYHINKKASNKLTPKKAKDSRMVRPLKESPAGPQAVRSSTFALMGYVVFSVQAVGKTHWTLNKAPSMSPLEGSVQMKVSCELAVSVEFKGFLTMFEDVSGFGAWHRRWCLLKGDTLCYWKYPDDEKKKPPIDSISLKNSITTQVGPVSRDICARLHTFLIEREREAQPQDKDSLTVICKGNRTVIRHLLSADTKEERIEWCSMFNKSLTALRMWGNM